MATPKDNMFKAHELLANKDDKINLDYLRQIVETAVKQQSKADTARKLTSNLDACLSTANFEPKTIVTTNLAPAQLNAGGERPESTRIPSLSPPILRYQGIKERIWYPITETITEDPHRLSSVRFRHLAPQQLAPEPPDLIVLAE